MQKTTTIEIFYNHNRIASHRRLKGRTGQYSTITEHMPEDHQKYLEWNGDRFRKWAERIGINTYTAVNAILMLSGKLNDAPSGRLFRADFRTLQMCQSL